MALILCSHAWGLDPQRSPSEYVFDEWNAGQDFAFGAVHSLAQTPDGYLWVGAEAGLFRFNGITFQPMSGRQAGGLPSGPVQQLATDSDGNLYVLGRDMSLFRFRDGKAEDVLTNVLHAGRSATAMGVGQAGEVIVWTGSGAVWCRQGKPLRSLFRQSITRRNLLVIALAETPEHRLWMGSRDAGLLLLENGKLQDFSANIPDLKINAILPEDQTRLWIGTDEGAIRWDGYQLTQTGVPEELRKKQVIALGKDHEGTVWLSTSEALYRVTAHGEAAVVQPARLTGVNAIFEDREGNLWLGTGDGLARLRDNLFLSYPLSTRQRRNAESSPLYVDGAGRAWYSTAGGILNWRRGTDAGEIKFGNPDDTLYSISGRGNAVWTGTKYGGLKLIRCDAGCRLERSYRAGDGLAENAVTAVFAAADGSVWAGTPNSGVSKLQGTVFTTFTARTGLASDYVRSIAQTNDGTLWFATSGGLSTLRNGVWRTYSAADGLPPGAINCVTVDKNGVLWVAASYGVSFFRDGRFQFVSSFTSGEPVLGTAEQNGSLWVVTASRFFEVKLALAFSAQGTAGSVREFGAVDGFLTGSIARRSPVITSDSLGRIWLSTSRGVSVVNPRRLPAQSVSALPHLQAVIADGSELDLPGNGASTIKVPALRKRLVFDFIGLSLTAPQRVQYQYRLDNFDADWSKPVATREAVYTNLPPGSYRFRVRASNSAGLWSGNEESVPVQVEPAFWQTWWFEGGSVLAAGLCFAAAYVYRLRVVRRRLHLNFQERLFERTRIAQELHDTLLQDFLSASMQLHVAGNRLEQTSLARAPLQRATELMRKAGDEGRAALRQLRLEEDVLSLQDAFSTIPDELIMSGDVDFRLRVEGSTAQLRHLVRDDIYRICREAIVNAVRHSNAKNIDVEVCYDPRELRVTVEDDGCGIDPKILRSGREGHWGIRGMRERADRIEGKLRLVSRPGGGTEVLLRIPGKVAYEAKKS